MPATPETNGYPRMEPVLTKIAEIIRRWRAGAATQTDLSQCDREEMARMARDTGVCPAELFELVRQGPHAADLLPEMMVALGLDPESVKRAMPEVMHDLQRLCSQCGSKRECADDLANNRADTRYHGYCLNALTLDALKAG